MKPIVDILNDANPKAQAKLEKAFTKGGSLEKKDQLMAELNLPTAVDFPNHKVIVTDHYICDYEFYAGLGSMLSVIEISGIERLYRSNITAEHEYDFDRFFVTMEMKDNSVNRIAYAKRNAKTFMTEFSDLIACINEKKQKIGAEV